METFDKTKVSIDFFYKLCVMNKKRLVVAYRNNLKRLLQYFLQGLIVLAPIGITVFVIISLFKFIDGILPGILSLFFPDIADNGIHGIKGLGFVIVIVVVLFVGWISSSFVVKKLVDILDKVLENTPGIKFIYSSVKDFLEAFTGNKKKFDKPVLVNVDATDVWRVGFLIQKDASTFEIEDHVVVYVPYSYAISGVTYIVPKERVKPLNNVSAADAMKFAISGGVTEVND